MTAHRPRKVAGFEVVRVELLDREGHLESDAPPFARDREALVALYRALVLTRTFDARAISLQRTGRLGTYASSLGQEAVGVGLGSAMLPEDVLLPSFREHGAQLLRGVTPVEILLYWGGHERGSDFAVPREDLPVCIPVASHIPHAVGVALAMQLRGEARAAVCVFGDGATSKGDFYEALNLAGVWKLPAVFVATNNEWAISVPRSAQTAAETLAQKAIAAGIPGIQVDGNDVIAVRSTVEEALARARAGDGATLVEALTYRLADHTTADDAGRYRDPGAVEARRAIEPISRLRRHLEAEHGFSAEDEDRLERECRAVIDAAAEEYLALAPEGPEAMFDHLYAELPAELVDQRASVCEELRGAATDD